jgi:tRNA pseudouridine38-40 synthase
MHYYKAIVQYDGSDYFGFQWQKGIPTVQLAINEAFQQILSVKVTTMGASRTDSGVHAFEQIVKITTDFCIKDDSFRVKLNQALPGAIRCLSLSPCEGSFNPITAGKTKEYRYLFTNKLQSSCREQKFIANNPYILNIDLMKTCAEMLIGVHDFHNFCSAGSNVKTTVREVSYCELSEVNPHEVLNPSELFKLDPDLKHCFQLKIEGNGFLKQMVRHLMSALWLVGSGRLTPEEFSILLEGPKKNKRLWKVASPRGLFLYKFNYPVLSYHILDLVKV